MVFNIMLVVIVSLLDVGLLYGLWAYLEMWRQYRQAIEEKAKLEEELLRIKYGRGGD